MTSHKPKGALKEPNGERFKGKWDAVCR